MDIYKLSDEIPEGGLTKKHKYDKIGCNALDDAGVSGGELKITDIRQAVKNQNRVNVFVNSQYEFSLDLVQVVDLKIKVGMAISKKQLEEYRKVAEFGKLYQRALEWVLMRPRSRKEVIDFVSKKVYEKGLDKKYIDNILERLEKKKYINDEDFARYYVENRFTKKGVSKKRLEAELMKKGVSRDIIERVLSESERDEETEISKMIARKRAQYDDEKLISYLCRQGFDYQLVRNLVLNYGRD